MLWWTRRLLRRAHPWPHRDSAGPGIVEGGPHRGARVVVARAVVLVFPLALALILAFATGGHGSSCCGVCGGSSCCGGHPPPEGVE
jgi:hypothetical protein